MATIYQRTGTYVDRMVILEPREALIYPFDLGSDWTELRFGAFLSQTSVDDDNSLGSVIPNLQQINADYAINNLFFGFIGWTGNVKNLYELPKLTGVYGNPSPNYTNYFGYSNAFVGGSSLGSSITDYYRASENATTYLGAYAPGGTAYGKGVSMFISTSGRTWSTHYVNVDAGLLLPSGNQLYTGRYYAKFNMLTLTRNLTNNTFSIICPSAQVSLTSAQFDTDSPTVENARIGLSRSQGAVRTTTGYLSHNAQSGGQFFEPIPSGIIIYCPFFNVRLRVHALAIERYS